MSAAALWPVRLKRMVLGLPLAFCRRKRLVDGSADGVAGIRRRDDALGPGESDTASKVGLMGHGQGLDQAFVEEKLRETRGPPVAWSRRR